MAQERLSSTISPKEFRAPQFVGLDSLLSLMDQNKALVQPLSFDLVQHAFREHVGAKIPGELTQRLGFAEHPWLWIYAEGGNTLPFFFISGPTLDHRNPSLASVTKTLEIERITSNGEAKPHSVHVAGVDSKSGRILAATYSIFGNMNAYRLNISLSWAEAEYCRREFGSDSMDIIPTHPNSPHYTAGLVTQAMVKETMVNEADIGSVPTRAIALYDSRVQGHSLSVNNFSLSPGISVTSFWGKHRVKFSPRDSSGLASWSIDIPQRLTRT